MTELASPLAAKEQALSAAERQELWKERRRFRRKPVILASTLETRQGTLQCVTLDLSLGGARIRVHEKLEPLELITLVLGKFGRFPGHVVWRIAADAGLQFSDPPGEIAVRFGNEIPLE